MRSEQFYIIKAEIIWTHIWDLNNNPKRPFPLH